MDIGVDAHVCVGSHVLPQNRTCPSAQESQLLSFGPRSLSQLPDYFCFVVGPLVFYQSPEEEVLGEVRFLVEISLLVRRLGHG